MSNNRHFWVNIWGHWLTKFFTFHQLFEDLRSYFVKLATNKLLDSFSWWKTLRLVTASSSSRSFFNNGLFFRIIFFIFFIVIYDDLFVLRLCHCISPWISFATRVVWDVNKGSKVFIYWDNLFLFNWLFCWYLLGFLLFRLFGLFLLRYFLLLFFLGLLSFLCRILAFFNDWLLELNDKFEVSVKFCQGYLICCL